LIISETIIPPRKTRPNPDQILAIHIKLSFMALTMFNATRGVGVARAYRHKHEASVKILQRQVKAPDRTGKQAQIDKNHESTSLHRLLLRHYQKLMSLASLSAAKL
jgi:hypothetical protein